MNAPESVREFRRTMGFFATGVTVIATRSGHEVHAMTANAVTSLSLDPLLVLVCVGEQTRMAETLEGASVFSINILREDQQALSTYFAGGWKQETRPAFRFVQWDGGPRLEGCLASVGCKLDQTIRAGDHWIVIGRVIGLWQGIEPFYPLVFYSGQYGRLSTVETSDAPDLGWDEVPVQVFYDPWQEDTGY